MRVPLALDTETDLITPGNQAPDLACVAIRSRGLGIRRLIHWTDYDVPVTWALTQPEVLIVGHTIAYDMLVLAAANPGLIPLIFDAYNQDRITDTEIRAKLLDIAAGQRKFHVDEDAGTAQRSTYSLDSLSQRFLGRTLDKSTWRLKYGQLRKLPLAQWPLGAVEYPLGDVDATEDLFAVQEREDPRFLIDQFRQARAAFWIKLMTAWGIRTDAQGVWELAQRTGQEYDRIAEELRAAGLMRADRVVKRRSGLVETEPGSRILTAARDRIVRAYQGQGKAWPVTKGGAPCTDDQSCRDSGDPLLIQYAELASLKKVLSTDVPLLEQGLTTAIHSRFDPLKETGRVGSSDPNITNLKRKGGIRECFVPRCLICQHVFQPQDITRGQCRCGRSLTVFVSCDYSGAELCTLAQVCLVKIGFSTLATAMNEGRDPHIMIAEGILERPYSDLKDVYDLGAADNCASAQGAGSCSCRYCWIDNARQTGKVGNFGFPGGLGAPAFVHFALNNYGVRLTEEQAKRLKRIWAQTWPEMKQFFQFVSWHTDQNFPQIEQLFSGRWRGFTGARAYTEACNTLFQGLASDMAKHAGWLIAMACYLDTSSPLFGCRIVNFVHDEFILEAPEDRGHEAAQELSRLMLEAARIWIPDVKIKAKPVISRRYSKKAKQVWENGRLIAWAA